MNTMNTTHHRATKASALCIAAFCLVPGASASIFRNETSNPRRALSQQQDSWYTGTATWYGGPDGPGPDGMSIYTGSCKYEKNIPSHFVSAINTDGGYDYGLTDLCGQCFEVMCVNGRQRGLEDSILGPWAGCVDAGAKSVTVMITDSCPCGHPNPSNQRHCCGGEADDGRHLDLSYAAFDSVALRHRGLVDVKYRKTDCSTLGEEKYYT